VAGNILDMMAAASYSAAWVNTTSHVAFGVEGLESGHMEAFLEDGGS
jgi:hypothetical protein